MTTTTSGPTPSAEARKAVEQPLAKASLPRWTPWAVLVVSIVAAYLVLIPAGSPIPGVAVLAGLLNLVLTAVVSTIKEGSRKAKDRVVTALVTTAFVVAMVPLVSVEIGRAHV